MELGALCRPLTSRDLPLTSLSPPAISPSQVRSADLESDVRAQLKALRECNATLYTEPHRLRALPAGEVLTYFGRCWRGTWRDFVANAMPYVCVRAWMSVGFKPHQFMLVRQQKLRASRSEGLLSALSNFTGLTYNRKVLRDKGEELDVHCEAPPNPKPPPFKDEHVLPAAKRGGGRRRATRGRRLDDASNRPLVNTHADYTGHDAVRRTQLGGATLAELTRLANAHAGLLDGLGLFELS